MSSKLRLLPVCIALAAPVPFAVAAEEDLPSAERYRVRLEYLWWSPEPDAQLQKGFSDTEGTVLDAREDLGVQESAANLLQGTLRFGGGWKLRGAWHRLDYRGDVSAARSFVYGNAAVTVDARVVTSLKGDHVTAMLEWDALQKPFGHVGIVFGASYFDVDTVLVATADPQHVTRVVERERLPIPALGLTARVYPLRRLSLEGELAGMRAGDRGQFLEIRAAARLHATDFLAATVGWHDLHLEGRDGRDSLEFGLGTWTFGLELSL